MEGVDFSAIESLLFLNRHVWPFAQPDKRSESLVIGNKISASSFAERHITPGHWFPVGRP
jgi:hypothetical protein